MCGRREGSSPARRGSEPAGAPRWRRSGGHSRPGSVASGRFRISRLRQIRERGQACSSFRVDAETGEHGVDDVLDEAVVKGGVAVEESVVERSVDEVERELDVAVQGELAAIDRT